MKHVAACCTKCSICDRNITMGQMDDHLKTCHKGEKIPTLTEQITRSKMKKVLEGKGAVIESINAKFQIRVTDPEKAKLLHLDLLREWKGITFSPSVINFNKEDYTLSVTIPLNSKFLSIGIDDFITYIRAFCKQHNLYLEIQ